MVKKQRELLKKSAAKNYIRELGVKTTGAAKKDIDRRVQLFVHDLVKVAENEAKKRKRKTITDHDLGIAMSKIYKLE